MNIKVYVGQPNYYELPEWSHFLIQMESFRIKISTRVSSQNGVYSNAG